MAYKLEALIGEVAALREFTPGYRNAALVPLEQGMALVPLTKRLKSEIVGDQKSELEIEPIEDFSGLPPEMVRAFEVASTKAPVAYVQLESFGGPGFQVGIIWNNGQRVWGPIYVADEDPTTKTPLHALPVNVALRRLGVEQYPAIDEFEAMRLGRYRFTDEWLQASEESGNRE